MAIIDGRTLEDAADVTTGFAAMGTVTLSLDTDTLVFDNTGSSSGGSISCTADNTGGGEGIYWDNGADQDVTDEIFYIWINIANPGLMEVKASGGIYVRAANNAGVANYVERYIEGSDTYSGGWKMFVIDMNDVFANADATGGTRPVITACRYIGVGVDLITGAMPKMQDNFFMDGVWSLPKGTPGIRVEGTNSGDPWTWADIVDAGDIFDNTKAWGTVQEQDGNITLYCSIEFGDDASTTSTEFSDATGANVVFGEGANPLPDDIYEITIVGNATGTCDVDFGTVVGTGDDRQGIGGTNWSTGGPLYTLDAETDIAHVDTVNFYGGSFKDSGVLAFSGSTKTDLIGLTFTGCGEIQPNDSEFLNCTIISPSDTGVEMLTTHTMKQLSFIAGSNTNEVDQFVTASTHTAAAPSAVESYSHGGVSAGNSDVALIVMIGAETGASSDDVIGVTYAGVPMTLLHHEEQNNITNIHVWIYILYNPSEGGSQTVAVTCNTAFTNMGIATHQVEGASRIQEVETGGANNNTASLSTTQNLTQDTSLTLAMVYVDTNVGGTFAASGDATLLTDSSIGTEAGMCTAEINAADAIGSGDRSQGFTWTGINDAALAYVNIKSIGAEHHVHFPASSDYSITMTDMQFFGMGAAGTPKWHGENSGSGADVTITSAGTTNATANEFEMTNETAGTIDVVASVNVNIHVEDAAGVDVEGAQVSIHRATKVEETSGTGNTAQDPDLVITGTIPADQPGGAYLTVNDRSLAPVGTQGYRHASHDGVSTFTFPPEVTFACTGSGTSTALQDTVNSFITLDIEEGDTIRNDTDGSWAMVDTITDASNIVTTPLQGGTDDTWTSGDFYSVHQLATTLVSGTDTVDMMLSNGQTDANGDAPTLSYDKAQAPTAVTVRVRYNGGATKYVPFVTSATIDSTNGLTLNVVLTEDTVAT